MGTTSRGLKIRGLSKHFGDTSVLRGLDLDVKPGEFLCLLGPSGCGKSTLLRILAGFEEPSNGTVETEDGVSLVEVLPSQRDIAMVFQNFALYPHMSVHNNIAAPLVIRRLSWAQRQPILGALLPRGRALRAGIARDVERVATQLRISHLLGRKPGQLSGGQKQRVAIGRALIREPRLFLMDEPLSSLDAALRTEMRGEIVELQRRLGITTIYVTHDQTEAMTMADRIVLMMDGRALQIGTPAEIFHNPHHLAVATFLGTPSINILPGETSARGVRCLGHELPIGVSRPAGCAVQIGVRPEDMDIGAADSGYGGRLPWSAIIERLEPIGHETLIHARLDGGLRIIARLAGHRLAHFTAPADGHIAVGFEPSHVKLFDKEGARLPHMAVDSDAPAPTGGGGPMSPARVIAGSRTRATAGRTAIHGFLLASPAILFLSLLIIAPIFLVFGMSFTDYSLGALNVSFIGLSNYLEITSDARALGAMGRTLLYVAIAVPMAVLLGLFLALMIQRRGRLRHMYEVLFFLPATSTFVAMALVWQFLLHGRIGPINDWLVWVGMGRIDFLTDPATALPTLAVIGAWQLVGQTTILFLAGLSSVSPDIYDAAALDGMEHGWDRFIRITFPTLAPTTLFVAVTTTITAFQAFDAVAALTQGGPAGSTETLLYKIYLEAYQYTNMGYASALSIVFLAFIVALSVFQIFVAEKKVHYS